MLRNTTSAHTTFTNCTFGNIRPSPYDRMRLILKRPTSSTQISSPTSGSETPHKYRQHHKLPQKYLQSTSRRIQRKLTLVILQNVHSCQQKSIGLKFCPKPEMTCGTVASIIRVVLLSPYLRIRAVSLSSIHYSQSHRVYINRRRQYICLI